MTKQVEFAAILPACAEGHLPKSVQALSFVLKYNVCFYCGYYVRIRNAEPRRAIVDRAKAL